MKNLLTKFIFLKKELYNFKTIPKYFKNKSYRNYRKQVILGIIR